MAWRHQAITKTSVDLWSQVFFGVQLMAISYKVFMNRNMCSQIVLLKLLPHLSGANELKHTDTYFW